MPQASPKPCNFLSIIIFPRSQVNALRSSLIGMKGGSPNLNLCKQFIFNDICDGWYLKNMRQNKHWRKTVCIRDNNSRMAAGSGYQNKMKNKGERQGKKIPPVPSKSRVNQTTKSNKRKIVR